MAPASAAMIGGSVRIQAIPASTAAAMPTCLTKLAGAADPAVRAAAVARGGHSALAPV